MNLQIASLMAAALTGNVRAYDNLSFDEAHMLRQWKKKFYEQHGPGSFWLYSNNEYAKCAITNRRCICANVEFLNLQAQANPKKSEGT